jgi:hypothetical protein
MRAGRLVWGKVMMTSGGFMRGYEFDCIWNLFSSFLGNSGFFEPFLVCPSFFLFYSSSSFFLTYSASFSFLFIFV